jgi:predicted O-methyltransferase YrrM
MIAQWLEHLPGARHWAAVWRRRIRRRGRNPFLKFAPPGHFYSPVPDIAFVDRYKDRLFDRRAASIPGIDTNAAGQLALIDAFVAYYGDLPFRDEKSPGLRYYYRNIFYSYGDAIILYSMLRHLRPQRVIEVGSGFSSAVMLDTNDLFLSRRVTFTFVEPNPQRLFSLLNIQDKARHEVITDIAQDVPVERFQALEANDILFIDSSHVAKIGSDVVHLITRVLPVLAQGVVVHFHDISWPFEYPEEWLREGKAWNENYMLKAFLQFNASFRVLCFNSYLAIHHPEAIQRSLPLYFKQRGSSLWIERTS